ncbi:hypothetical protein CRYUN_Cryun28dG0088900 [Craigia yunnanensis]
MAFAQQNNWHVLLDAGSLGPNDMDSLGLSSFRPDFIITSFYRLFGYDPTGFGCLLIKKSVMASLQNQCGHTGSGMVWDIFETAMDHDNSSDRDGASTIFDKAENLSVGDFMKSPVFSKDESSDNSNWIDLGQSPFWSDNSSQLTRQKTNSTLPSSWFSGKRNNKRLSPKLTSKIPESNL